MQMNVVDPPPAESHDAPSSDECANDRRCEDGNPESPNPAPSSHEQDTSAQTATPDSTEAPTELLGKLPPEIGMLLLLSGIAGILLPGPVGTPLLIAGGVTMWPKTFQPIENWFSRRFPQAHREGVHQIKQFVGCLHNRFPEP